MFKIVKIFKNKYIFGTVKVGERGQVVIPKEARNMFDIKPGDLLLAVGDREKGLAFAKIEGIKGYALKLLGALKMVPDENDIEEKSKK